jgi:hypothetical protein
MAICEVMLECGISCGIKQIVLAYDVRTVKAEYFLQSLQCSLTQTLHGHTQRLIGSLSSTVNGCNNDFLFVP